jgi:hypothetical protein
MSAYQRGSVEGRAEATRATGVHGFPVLGEEQGRAGADQPVGTDDTTAGEATGSPVSPVDSDGPTVTVPIWSEETPVGPPPVGPPPVGAPPAAAGAAEPTQVFSVPTSRAEVPEAYDSGAADAPSAPGAEAENDVKRVGDLAVGLEAIGDTADDATDRMTDDTTDHQTEDAIEEPTDQGRHSNDPSTSTLNGGTAEQRAPDTMLGSER